jgi:hypothetical protein
MLASLLLLVACGGAGVVDVKDDMGDTSGGDTAAAGTVPEVVSVETVDCTTQQSAGEVWQLALTANDPQGADTIASGRVSVLNGQGGELAGYDLACNDGSCFGSFRADYNGISCSLAGTLTMRFTVTDEDGNVSPAFDVAAR